MTYIVLFVIVLAGAIVSQGTVLYAVSNMHHNKTVSCYLYFRATKGSDNITRTDYKYDCSLKTEVDKRCMKPPEGYTPTTLPFDTQVCPSVKTQWVWCAFLMIVTPYFFVFLRCLWYICFRRKRNPTCGPLLAVCGLDSILIIYCRNYYQYDIGPYMYIIELCEVTTTGLIILFSFCKIMLSTFLR